MIKLKDILLENSELEEYRKLILKQLKRFS